MSRAGQRTYTPKHRRPDARAGRQGRLVAPAVFSAAVVGTVTAAQLSTGGSNAASGPEQLLVTTAAQSISTSTPDLVRRTAPLRRSLDRPNRSAVRVLIKAKPVTLAPAAVDHKFATALLNVWTGPGEQTTRIGLVPWGTRLPVTGQVHGHWSEVLLPPGAKGTSGGGADHKPARRTVARWVNRTYLADQKPQPVTTDTSGTGSPSGSDSSGSASSGSASSGSVSSGSDSSGSTSSAPSVAPSSGLSSAPCPDGSAVESGVTSGATRLYRAVCAAFPALSSYGGYDAHGEHADGRAIDFMVTDSALGQAVATWVQANAGALGVRDVIWAQHIWTPERSSEGWRYMSDRGSSTANHYDHVHVAVY